MAKLGTPENPEIIEPGAQTRPAVTAPSRWGIVRQLLKVIVGVTVPALGFGMIFFWTLHTALNYGGVLPWLALVIIALPSFMIGTIALIANLALWPALIFILMGRSVANPLQDPRIVRFKFGAR